MSLGLSCTIRLDIDTWVGLTQGLTKWLEITDQYEIVSTIALSLGPYKTGRGNLRRILNPKAPRSSKSVLPWKRTHWSDLFRGILTPVKNASSEKEVIKSASERHEIIPHGFDHTYWSHKFAKLSKKDTLSILNNMIKEYQEILGKKPINCAAPAMQVNSHYWKELEKLQFSYSSDIIGRKPFFAYSGSEDNQTKLKLVQLPITCSFMDTLLAEGYSNEAIVKHYISEIKEQALNNDYCCWVIHANFEPLRHSSILKEIIKVLKEEINFETLTEQANRFLTEKII
jgi:peptidoglycan/xylan/chitin deacetylase (PgdA/CDA1 family)